MVIVAMDNTKALVSKCEQLIVTMAVTVCVKFVRMSLGKGHQQPCHFLNSVTVDDKKRPVNMLLEETSMRVAKSMLTPPSANSKKRMPRVKV